jgi:hypothetical protein
MQTWFAVDKAGLAKLLERRGKQFILYELVQNAWDEKTTRVDIILKWMDKGYAKLKVSDDNPAGFANLAHAFTLFAESDKKGNAEKRGRFNLGEKLVLALCEEAQIISTKGTVSFDAKGRHESNTCTQAGSVFGAKLKLTQVEFDLFESAAQRLIPPLGVDTFFNGQKIEPRSGLAQMEATLATEIGDHEGVLRPTTRKTYLEVLELHPGETPMLYELGIPVVEVDMPWHVNIGQKVPLNMDRDNVTPAYLGRVRALVAEHMVDHLDEETANASWVRDAVSRHGEEMSGETIVRLADLRFGAKRVIYDPTDPEANALAASRGFTVVHGGSLNKAEWEAVRRVGAILPAGKVTPSPKPFHPEGNPLRLQKVLTPAMDWFVGYARRLAQELMCVDVKVTLACDPSWHFMGAYGPGSLTVNVAKVGKAWFSGSLASINEFLIHEYGHHYSGNHLSEEYHDALCRLGGQLSQLALDKPDLFKR